MGVEFLKRVKSTALHFINEIFKILNQIFLLIL